MPNDGNARCSCKIVLVCLLAILLAAVFELVPVASPVEAAGSSKDYSVNNTISLSGPSRSRDGIIASTFITFFFPFVSAYQQTQSCAGQTGQSYGTLSVGVFPPPTDPPADQHPDLNLSVRGYLSTTTSPNLVEYGGATDNMAPEFRTFFADNRIPAFTSAYQVYNWDWATKQRGSLITDWPVTLLGMGTTVGEVIQTPQSGYSVGQLPLGYAATVLYAATNRITLSYTTNGSTIWGYSIHIENICVDPSLLALYQTWNTNGRTRMPAVTAKQPLGRALGTDIKAAIRDNGSFMDPRSKKDWWVQ